MADAYMMSGHPFNQSVIYPSYGAVVAKEQGDRNAMPPYVQLGTTSTSGSAAAWPGFLGDQYNPFVLPGDASRPNFAVRDVVLPGGVDRGRFQHRMKVLHEVDTWQRQMEDDSGPTAPGGRHVLSEGLQPRHGPPRQEGVRHPLRRPEAPRPLRAEFARARAACWPVA